MLFVDVRFYIYRYSLFNYKFVMYLFDISFVADNSSFLTKFSPFN